MTWDLDTFLTTVYYFVDLLYLRQFAPLKPPRPGPPPSFSDSEVLTLSLLSHWFFPRSESRFLCFVRTHWLSYFPSLLSQSSFNKRIRDLAVVLCHLGPALAHYFSQEAESSSSFSVLDGIAIPLMKRCRGVRHRLFANEASFGIGGSDKEPYYGIKIVACIDSSGWLTGFVIGPAQTEERWLAEALLRWRRYPQGGEPRAEELAERLGKTHKRDGKRKGPTGPLYGVAGLPEEHPYLGDLGFQGKEWQKYWREEYGAKVITKGEYGKRKEGEGKERRKAKKWLSGLRQRIETTFSCVVGELGLKFPGARSYWGLLARIGAKLAAFNMALALNKREGKGGYEVGKWNPLLRGKSEPENKALTRRVA